MHRQNDGSAGGERRSSRAREEKTSPSYPGDGLFVGLGASAGSLDALKLFFATMPADSGLTFVVVQHLERHHPSVLAELLAKHTAMPVQQAIDGVRPQPDQVYIIPPNSVLALDRGLLRVTQAQEEGLRTPIDAFFRSLARERGESAVGIILSGAGSDGTAGLRVVKENGGLTLAQLPETAKYDSMPQSAITAGLVDFSLPVEEMPASLQAYAAHLTEIRRVGSEAINAQVIASLGPICEILERSTGDDFSRYKQGTLLRRIRRRIQLRQLASAEEYVSYLEQNPAEVELLHGDLLIGVTHFFRDPDAFKALEEHALPALLQDRDGRTLRIWVAGCASGEEVYSLAMLLDEHLSRAGIVRPVQIFGTDIDDEMLAVARRGVYPDAIHEHVSPERLERYFVQEGSSYHIVKGLREMCTFSSHNLIKDPPFSSLDLISCRNVLIYLGSELQSKLVPLFHYALRPGGYLLLGPSEHLQGNPELFVALDKKHRLFRRNDAVGRRPLEFPLSARMSTPGVVSSPVREPLDSSSPMMFSHAFERMVLEQYAPPCAVVNGQGEILYMAGRAGRVLQVGVGVPTNNIFDLAHGGLRAAVRDALARTVRSRRRIVRDDLVIETDGAREHWRLTVRPLPGVDSESGLYVVVLQSAESGEDTEVDLENVTADAEQAIIEQMENELRTTRADLQSALQELESANEELKSANEELLSTNEELQSANEELQTSKEELQSANDELHDKVQELDTATSDLQHHYTGTNIATIFVDHDLRITRFTPAATNLFNIRNGDVGRPLRDLAPGFVEEDLMEPVASVLRKETGRELRVRRTEGPILFLVRILPYYTQEKVLAGVGITFVDITAITREREAAQAIERARRHMQGLVDATTQVVAESGRTWEGLLQVVADAARELTGGRIVVVGHDGAEGHFSVGAMSRADDAPVVPPVASTRIERDGILTELSDRNTIRLTDPEMRFHPRWRGLPGHIPMRGVLGTRLVGSDGVANGVILATDRRDGDFTAEDEALLEQLGAIASLAMHQVQTRMQLEEADRNKSHFLAVLSHELRNPLAPIKHSLHILESAPAGGELARQAQAIMERQVDQLVRLVDDLLDVTRITRNKVRLQLQRLELNEVVRGVVEDHQTLFDERGIQLQVTPASDPVFLDADRSRITQILGNLLQNAAKFTPRGGQAAVTVTTELAASRAVLSIKDSGVGMEAEAIRSLFRPFMQVDSSLDRNQGGLGLGLALVKGLVDLHGGDVVATSAGLGKGTEVTVGLPLATGAVAVAEPTVARPEQSARRVLIIEDQADAAKCLELVLTLEGHQVATANDGPSGLEAARRFRPEVLLCAIGLPGMDGYEVARAFRSDPLLSRTFLVALTGYGLPDEIEHAGHAGFDRHLTKPVTVAQLAEILATAPDSAVDPAVDPATSDG